MALLNKLIILAVAGTIILPFPAVAAESAYLTIDIKIDNGKVAEVLNANQKTRPDFEYQSEGEYTVTLLNAGQVVATNHFDIPESFEYEVINLDGSRGTTQEQAGIISVTFIAPANLPDYPGPTPVDQAGPAKGVTVRISKGSEKILEETMMIYNWDTALDVDILKTCASESGYDCGDDSFDWKNLTKLLLIIGVFLLLVLSTIYFLHKFKKPTS